MCLNKYAFYICHCFKFLIAIASYISLFFSLVCLIGFRTLSLFLIIFSSIDKNGYIIMYQKKKKEIPFDAREILIIFSPSLKTGSLSMHKLLHAAKSNM